MSTILFENFLQFQLTVNLVAMMVAFVSAVFTGESVLTPVQLLWVNLIMDTMGALALATEPPSHDLLKRTPYGRNDQLITLTMWTNIVGQAIFQIGVLFSILINVGGVLNYFGITEDRQFDTIIFNVFVLSQLVNEFNSRRIYSEVNVFSGIFGNKIFCTIIAATLVVQVLVVEFGGDFTHTCHLNLIQWGFCVSIALLGFPIGLILRIMTKPLTAIAERGKQSHKSKLANNYKKKRN